MCDRDLRRRRRQQPLVQYVAIVSVLGLAMGLLIEHGLHGVRRRAHLVERDHRHRCADRRSS